MNHQHRSKLEIENIKGKTKRRWYDKMEVWQAAGRAFAIKDRTNGVILRRAWTLSGVEEHSLPTGTGGHIPDMD